MAESNPAPASGAKSDGEGGYKETIESILIAFILAFIFRAFVVEAFVIPTGSMAPTLYGAHMRFHCPDCGYVFDGGFRGADSISGDDVDIPSSALPLTDFHCPNCGYDFSAANEQPVRFGDRILVLKYLYLFQQPKRWDVVVFKSPDEGEHHYASDPEYSQNYIKRLIGIGPESVVLLDGHVFTGPVTADRPLDDARKPLWTIQRPPKYAQDAVWRTVNDNDFIPHLGKDDHFWQQPWQEQSPGSGWKLSGPAAQEWPDGSPSRIFAFANQSAGGAIAFNPDVNPDTHALTDFLVYDESEHRSTPHSWRPLWISDLKLACTYTRSAGAGALSLELSKQADVFTAEFAPGKVRLLRGQRVLSDASAVSDEHEIHSADLPVLSGSAPVRVEIRNVHYRVSVLVNDREVLSTTDEEYAPDVADLWKHEDEEQPLSGRDPPFSKPMVRIGASSQTGRIEHVLLARNIYYLSQRTAPKFWATTGKITHLKAGEYFTMGDNSFISGDARYWGTPVQLPHENLDVESGRVPERFMLGKAFFVYWPAGYPLPHLTLNAVPDFGEMRLIQ